MSLTKPSMASYVVKNANKIKDKRPNGWARLLVADGWLLVDDGWARLLVAG